MFEPHDLLPPRFWSISCLCRLLWPYTGLVHRFTAVGHCQGNRRLTTITGYHKTRKRSVNSKHFTPNRFCVRCSINVKIAVRSDERINIAQEPMSKNVIYHNRTGNDATQVIHYVKDKEWQKRLRNGGQIRIGIQRKTSNSSTYRHVTRATWRRTSQLTLRVCGKNMFCNDTQVFLRRWPPQLIVQCLLLIVWKQNFLYISTFMHFELFIHTKYHPLL